MNKIKRTFYINKVDWDNALHKAKPFAMADIIRALIKAWLNGEINVVWEDGEYRVKVD